MVTNAPKWKQTTNHLNASCVEFDLFKLPVDMSPCSVIPSFRDERRTTGILSCPEINLAGSTCTFSWENDKNDRKY